jgi:hypothetical protein
MPRTLTIVRMQRLGIFVGLMCISGCATIFSDHKYPVTVDNSGGATFFAVRNRKNQVIHQGVTPQQVTLDANAHPFWPAKYTVTYAGQGDYVQQREIPVKVDPWIAGNLLIGGVPGFLVDGATGAMWRLPERVTGDVPSQYALADVTEGARIASIHWNSAQPHQPDAAGRVVPNQGSATSNEVRQVKHREATSDEPL